LDFVGKEEGQAPEKKKGEHNPAYPRGQGLQGTKRKRYGPSSSGGGEWPADFLLDRDDHRQRGEKKTEVCAGGERAVRFP